jgi:hypothetical protein
MEHSAPKLTYRCHGQTKTIHHLTKLFAMGLEWFKGRFVRKTLVSGEARCFNSRS